MSMDVSVYSVVVILLCLDALILFYCVRKGWHDGILKRLSKTFSFVVSLVIVLMTKSRVTEFVYEKVVKVRYLRYLSGVTGSLSQKVTTLLNSMPSVILECLEGYDIETLASNHTPDVLVDILLKQISCACIQVIYVITALLILSLLFKVFFDCTAVLLNLPVIKQVLQPINKVTGALLNGLGGVFCVVVIDVPLLFILNKELAVFCTQYLLKIIINRG